MIASIDAQDVLRLIKQRDDAREQRDSARRLCSHAFTKACALEERLTQAELLLFKATQPQDYEAEEELGRFVPSLSMCSVSIWGVVGRS